MNRANYRLYRKSKAVTNYHPFEGRTHWLLGQPGWEEVADYSINWVEEKIGK